MAREKEEPQVMDKETKTFRCGTLHYKSCVDWDLNEEGQLPARNVNPVKITQVGTLNTALNHC